MVSRKKAEFSRLRGLFLLHNPQILPYFLIVRDSNLYAHIKKEKGVIFDALFFLTMAKASIKNSSKL